MPSASAKAMPMNSVAVCEAAAEDGRIAQGDIARILKFRDNPSDESWIGGGAK